MKYILLLMLSVSTMMAENFTLISPSIGGQLTKTQEANTFGCSGANVSPALMWSHAPRGTKSFAVTVYDPDAPTGSGWWHWLVVNIPVKIEKLKAGTVPKSALEIVNDYGTVGFGGACPPEGDKAHQYIFTVHALDVEKLPVESTTNAPIVGYQINAHTIEKASIISYYKRSVR